MTRNIPRFVCLIAVVGVQASLMQGQSQEDIHQKAKAEGRSAVAYVYVSTTPKNGNVSQIEAFAATKNGKLTPVPGSPFAADEGSLAVNERYLFGANTKTPDIDAYSIEPNGALMFASSSNYAKYNPDDCGIAGLVFLDRTGRSVYAMEFEGDCSNNLYQSFAVKQQTGELANLGTDAVNSWLTLPASFLGNDRYAYSASCLGNMYWGIFGFERASNGLLKEIGNTPTPNAKQGDFYCPSNVSTDPANHVAIAMQAVNGQTFASDGAAQIATYTADGAGTLATKSTQENMPELEVGSVNDIKIDPSGGLLAVGGSGGLQIFHFNGSRPITRYTDKLTSDAIDQFFWDNDDHIYAISREAGKLFVFTVKQTSGHEAPGSPYKVSQPQSIVVQAQ